MSYLNLSIVPFLPENISINYLRTTVICNNAI